MIKNIVYHVLIKEQGSTQNVSIDLNPSVLSINDSTNKLLEQLLDRYRGRAGKGYGVFEINTDSYPTSAILLDYLDDESPDDFYSTTERLMNHLMSESHSHAGAKGGKVVFIHYEEDSKDYFLVAILTEKVGLMAKDWTLTQDDILNFENLRFAGRINITTWQDANSENQRYISFLKGQGEVAGYFKKFMGCSDVLMASQETQQLIIQIKAFGVNQGLCLDDRIHLNTNAKVYLKELADDNLHFSLQAFANRVWPDNPQSLIDSFEEYGNVNDFCISDGFVPDKRSLSRLVAQSYRTKHWAFSFDDEAIKEGDVEVLDGMVIFKNPPENILEAYSDKTED